MKAVSNYTLSLMLRLLTNYAALLSSQPDARTVRNTEERRKIQIILRRFGGKTNTPKPKTK